MDEVLELAHPRRLGHAREHALGALEPENADRPPEEIPAAAVEDQRHVVEVRADVGALQLPVERVDQRLHLLVDPRGDRASGELDLELRAAHHLLERRDEARRDRHDRDDLSVLQLMRRLCRREAHKLHVLADLIDRLVDVEAVAADHDRRRQVVLVHERDARLRARVARDEADEHRDRQRVGEQDPEQQRRPAQHERVLPQ